MDALTTVKPYSNEIHAQAQLWLKRDPKASYEAWKKCLPARGSPVLFTLCSFVQEHLCPSRFNKECASVGLRWLVL